MDEITQGKHILKDEKRTSLQPGSTSVFQKLVREKTGLSGQNSAMEIKGESVSGEAANSVRTAEILKKT